MSGTFSCGVPPHLQLYPPPNPLRGGDLVAEASSAPSADCSARAFCFSTEKRGKVEYTIYYWIYFPIFVLWYRAKNKKYGLQCEQPMVAT